jgi:hypothetical protein
MKHEILRFAVAPKTIQTTKTRIKNKQNNFILLLLLSLLLLKHVYLVLIILYLNVAWLGGKYL